MLESIGLFFAAYLLTWPALIAFLVLGIIFEHSGSRKSAIFAGLVSMGISYFYFDVSLKTIWYYVAVYLVVGVAWSFWRYRNYVSQRVKVLSEVNWASQEDKQQGVNGLIPSQNLERITSWIIVWPFSLIESVLGDIITLIQGLVTKVFKGVYYRIFVSQTQELLDRVERPKEVK